MTHHIKPASHLQDYWNCWLYLSQIVCKHRFVNMFIQILFQQYLSCSFSSPSSLKHTNHLYWLLVVCLISPAHKLCWQDLNHIHLSPGAHVWQHIEDNFCRDSLNTFIQDIKIHIKAHKDRCAAVLHKQKPQHLSWIPRKKYLFCWRTFHPWHCQERTPVVPLWPHMYKELS